MLFASQNNLGMCDAIPVKTPGMCSLDTDETTLKCTHVYGTAKEPEVNSNRWILKVLNQFIQFEDVYS